MEFTDKRNRVLISYHHYCYYDCVCVRLKADRDFNSNTSFHFDTQQQADQFVELLKIAS